jgi:protein SCO1
LKKKRAIWIFFGLCFLIPLSIYAVVNWYEKHLSALPVIGEKTEGRPHTVTAFQLLNQEGKMVSPGQWKGKTVVANFFFTHCPVVCPKMMRNMKTVEEATKNKDLMLVSFTVDPQRDSVQQLKSYARRMGLNTTRWDLLTGDKKEIYRLARKSFLVVAADGDGGADDFIHSDKLVLIDRRLQIRGFYDGTENEDIKQLLIDINKLKHEN